MLLIIFLSIVLKRSHDASGSPIRRFSALGQDQGGNAAASSPQTGALHRERTAIKKEKVSRDPKTGKGKGTCHHHRDI